MFTCSTVRAGPQPASLSKPIHPIAAQAGAVGLLAVILVADYVTSPYLALSIFYLFPVAIMAWYAGRAHAIIIGAVAAGAGTIAIASQASAIPVSISVLNGTFRFVIFVFVALLVDGEHRARVRIVQLSTSDPLTGLLNRRAFYAQATDRIHQCRRRRSPVTLIYTDLDDLKDCNDHDGHDAGDRMIIACSQAMISTFRDVDLVTRIGGDEFCCLMTDTDEASGEVAIRRLEEILLRIGPKPICASIGAVSIVPIATTDIAELVHEADLLMYRAKQTGKGRHCTRTIPAHEPPVGEPSRLTP